MGSELPDIGRREFESRLLAATPTIGVAPDGIAAMYEHYEELRRWNRRLSLVGPGTSGAVVERHFAESVNAAPLIPAAARTLVDLGSGGGFPGLVLAAVRPDLSVCLIEAREKKWAFLEAASHRAALSALCLNARVGSVLPPGVPLRVDVLTVRAVRLDRETLDPFVERLSAVGRVLLWTGEESPEVPRGLEVVSTHPIDSSRHRRILELRGEGEESH